MRLLAIAVWFVGATLVAAQRQDDAGMREEAPINQNQDDLSSLIKDVFSTGGQKPNQNENPAPAPVYENIKENASPDVVPANSGLGGDECQCVPYYLCANNTIITDGTGLLDIRLKEQNCDSYLDICCKEPLDEEHKITPQKQGRRGCGTRNIDGVGFRIIGAENNEAQFGEFPWMIAVIKVDLDRNLKVYQCGGALIHEQVVLTAAHCVHGKDASSLIIRAGEWDTQTKNELYPHQDSDVAQVIIHENYYAGALYNDIALLILKDPMSFADNVDIVCLPKQSNIVMNEECYASGWGKDVFGKETTTANPKPPNQPLVGVNQGVDSVRQMIHDKIDKFKTLFGHRSEAEPTTVKPISQVVREKIDKFKNLFGPKKEAQPSSVDERIGEEPPSNNPLESSGKDGQYQVILKKIDLPMVNRQQCQASLRKTRLGQYFQLHDSFVCAGGVPGKDTCKGDGGSPLVCPIPGTNFKYQQVGIVAWGIGCGNDIPAVYVNVAHFRNWIDHQLKQFNFVTEYDN